MQAQELRAQGESCSLNGSHMLQVHWHSLRFPSSTTSSFLGTTPTPTNGLPDTTHHSDASRATLSTGGLVGVVISGLFIVSILVIVVVLLFKCVRASRDEDIRKQLESQAIPYVYNASVANHIRSNQLSIEVPIRWSRKVAARPHYARSSITLINTVQSDNNSQPPPYAAFS